MTDNRHSGDSDEFDQESTYMTQSDWLLVDQRRRTLRDIFREVGLAHGVPLSAIFGPSRITRISNARQHGMAVAHRHGYSTIEIGDYLDRDHSTILHGIKAVEYRLSKLTKTTKEE